MFFGRFKIGFLTTKIVSSNNAATAAASKKKKTNTSRHPKSGLS